MLFNLEKCKCLHTRELGCKLQNSPDTTEKKILRSNKCCCERAKPVGIAASKGNTILGLIRRNVTYKEKGIIIPVYKSIVRPHLEYYIQAWRPYCKKDIDTLERIQGKTTKMIPELRYLSYEYTLTKLETRRLR